MRNLKGIRTQVSWGEEVPVEQSLSGGTVEENQVYGLSGLTESKYKGQVAIVKPRSGGSVNAKRYHIVDNTTNAITFEEDVQDDGLTNSDTLIITQINVTPDDISDYFGPMEEADLPTPSVEVHDVWAHGSTYQPARHSAVQMKRTYESTFPVKLVNGKLLYLGMGMVYEDPSGCQTKTDLSATLAQDTIIGQSVITTSADLSGSLTVGDHICVDYSGTYPEVRQVTAVNATTVTLSKPLRIPHDSGADLYKVSIGTGYMKHIMLLEDSVPSWTFEAVFKGYQRAVTNADYVNRYNGIKVKTLSFSSTPGDSPLQVDMEIAALKVDEGTTRTSSVDMTDYGGTPYLHKKTTVTINGVVYAQAGDFSGSIKREMTTKIYHNDQNTIDPWEHIEGEVTFDFKVTVPLHNRNFYDLLMDGTEFDVSFEYERGTNDKLLIEFLRCYLTDAPEKLVKGGEIPVDVTASPGGMKITVTDNIEFY